MTNTRKTQNVKSANVKKEMKNIDKLFSDLQKDKTLPTFGEFFVECLLLGIEEQVNLRVMYPKTYTKTRRSLDAHTAAIQASQR